MFLNDFQQLEIQRFFRWKPKLSDNAPLWAWAAKQWVRHLSRKTALLRAMETESIEWSEFSLDLSAGWMQFLWNITHRDGSLWVDVSKCMEWPINRLGLSLSVCGNNTWWQDADGNRRSSNLDEHRLEMTRVYTFDTLPQFERKIETVLRGMNDAMKYQILFDTKRQAKLKRPRRVRG